MPQTKEELLRVLGLQEEEGSSLQFLRRGYKVLPIELFIWNLRLPFKLLLQIYSVSGNFWLKNRWHSQPDMIMQTSTWWEEGVDLELSSAWRS